jgi:hypothetical protein
MWKLVELTPIIDAMVEMLVKKQLRAPTHERNMIEKVRVLTK